MLSKRNFHLQSLKSSQLASALAITCYAIYLILIEADHRLSKTPVCAKLDFSAWSWYTNMIQAGGLFTIIGVLLVKKCRCSNPNAISREVYFVIFCCVCMSSTTTTLTLAYNWGGVCIDALGVATPAAIWGEWMFCAPLLLFSAVSLDNKSQLSREDMSLIFSLFLSILFGFFILFRQPQWLAIIWLILSCLFYLVVYKVLYDTKVKLDAVSKRSDSDSDEYRREFESTTRKLHLCCIFAFLMPIYVVVYFLAMFGALNLDETRVAFQFCDLMTKGMFSLVSMESHFELLHPAALEILNSKRANEARRGFLKYIFHEVRVPLNSMTMGIDYLDRCDNLDEDQKDSLLMMREASVFMSDTLNSVLNMQKIEEGKLELEFAMFSMRAMLKSVRSSFEVLLVKHCVVLDVRIPFDFPQLIFGDRARVEYVISNLVSNAIKFSPDGSTISVLVTWIPNLPALPAHFADVMISVSDEGPGIAQEDLNCIFSSFMQPSNGSSGTARHESGVGLSVCKQLVTLHGGKLRCRSELGHGSTFFVCIPFAYEKQAVETAILSGETRRVPSVSSAVSAYRLLLPSSNEYKSEESKGSGGSVPQHPQHSQHPHRNSRLIRNRLLGTSTSGLVRMWTMGDCTPSNRSPNPSVRESPTNDPADTKLMLNKEEEDDGSLDEMRVTSPVPQPKVPMGLVDKLLLMSTPENKLSLAVGGLVLVVDDVMSNRKMLKLLLEKKGLSVEMAADGQEALLLVRSMMETYSMIFMDNMMPIMNGTQTTAALREDGFNGLIVGVTGCAMDDDLKLYVDAGADFVITKPVTMLSLDLILDFVREKGAASKKGFKLSRAVGGLAWVQR